MLTQEGKEAACDCLKRSGIAESQEKSASVEIPSYMDKQNSLEMELSGHDLESEVMSPLTEQKKPMDVPLDSLERVFILLFKVVVASFVSSYSYHMLLPFTCSFSASFSDAESYLYLYGIKYGLLFFSYSWIHFLEIRIGSFVISMVNCSE